MTQDKIRKLTDLMINKDKRPLENIHRKPLC